MNGHVAPPIVKQPIVLPYPPTMNHLYVSVGRRRILSDVGKRFKQEVAIHLRFLGIKPIIGPVALTVHIYRPRRTGDLDNLLKATQDSLSGFLWVDDKQIVEINARRYDDKENPRAEIWVETVNT